MGQVSLCCATNVDDPFTADKTIKARKRAFSDVKLGSLSKDYTLKEVIGVGSYGEVHLGVHNRTHNEVAIKKIPLQLSDKESVSMVFNEIKVLSYCVSTAEFN